MRANDLLSRLRRLADKRGWDFRERPGRGSHVVVTVRGKHSSIPMHRGDMPPGTYRGILKALGLKPGDVED
jgi:predicted RNA binding protein YcfA (HicA-like mRNA interferase family)